MSTQQDLEKYILWLSTPFGDRESQNLHEQAVHYMLQHADLAQPRLLELLESGESTNIFAIMDILPKFGRPESVPVLANVLADGEENVANEAALALAQHPLTTARDALVSALSSSNPIVVSAAADGLFAMGDKTACAALRAVHHHPNANTRYHIIQTEAQLGCLSSDDLATTLNQDNDPDIRDMLTKFMDKNNPS